MSEQSVEVVKGAYAALEIRAAGERLLLSRPPNEDIYPLGLSRRTAMAMMMIQEFVVEETDRSTTNYDAVEPRLNAREDPPKGLIVHTAGFTGKGSFRIADVWESVADWEAFRDGRLAEAVKPVMEADPDAAPPEEYTYELHDVIKP